MAESEETNTPKGQTGADHEKLNAKPYVIGGEVKGYNIDEEEYARLSRSYASDTKEVQP